ncbi:MAG: hypothetical protein JWO07_808 [Candidatus Saccharibacteria bacterium]|nr:hypothetical protein [Candidatus Saccharibacteria bacterium]
MNSEELDRFIRDMLAQKDLPGVNDDVREQLVTDLKERLLDQVDRAIVDAIPEDKIDDFNALLDQSDVSDETIQNYVVQSGVDVQQVTINTMLRFRDLYLTPQDARE